MDLTCQNENVLDHAFGKDDPIIAVYDRALFQGNNYGSFGPIEGGDDFSRAIVGFISIKK